MQWGPFQNKWVPLEVRDSVLDFIESKSLTTKLSVSFFLKHFGIANNRYYEWRGRKGKPNQNNYALPKNNWITPEEKESILKFHSENPLVGYRALTYMMIDQDVACLSPASVHRILREAGVINSRPSLKTSLKGTGFVQPTEPHQHYHVDISYLKLGSTFYYCTSILDGYSRAILNWSIEKSMPSGAIEILIQEVKEKYPGHNPRIITDNGPQFLSQSFKDFIRKAQMTHVKTSPYYPQSNGKIERYHRTMKGFFRLRNASTIEEARAAMGKVVGHYNHERLHYALDFISPINVLENRKEGILKVREKRIKKAKQKRREYWNKMINLNKGKNPLEKNTKKVA